MKNLPKQKAPFPKERRFFLISMKLFFAAAAMIFFVFINDFAEFIIIVVIFIFAAAIAFAKIAEDKFFQLTEVFVKFVAELFQIFNVILHFFGFFHDIFEKIEDRKNGFAFFRIRSYIETFNVAFQIGQFFV